jgi:hypothetical protein
MAAFIELNPQSLVNVDCVLYAQWVGTKPSERQQLTINFVGGGYLLANEEEGKAFVKLLPRASKPSK